jgi:PTS system nitrogen regulatory IIA component
MRLVDVLEKENIIPDLKAGDKRALLDEMVTHLSLRVEGFDKERALDALLKREELGTTGVGHGVAIPHGKIKGLDKITVCFGRSLKGVDFNSMDGLSVHLFFLIISPDNSAAAHLKLLACISRLLKDREVRSKLRRLGNKSDIFKLIAEADRRMAAL